MQGLFKLGLTGTKEQLKKTMEMIKSDPALQFFAADVPVKPFKDRCKVVIENEGSGNISGVEDAYQKLLEAVPEIEAMLLTQHLDSPFDECNVNYSRAASNQDAVSYSELYAGLDEQILEGISAEDIALLLEGSSGIDEEKINSGKTYSFGGKEVDMSDMDWDMYEKLMSGEYDEEDDEYEDDEDDESED